MIDRPGKNNALSGGVSNKMNGSALDESARQNRVKAAIGRAGRARHSGKPDFPPDRLWDRIGGWVEAAGFTMPCTENPIG